MREKKYKINSINDMNMSKKGIVMAFLLAVGLPGSRNVQAQTTYEEMEQLTVNEQITTVITASEPVRFVDISTDKVAGDQPIDNVIRLKPKEAGHEDGEVLAIVTIVTERYRTQYALVYTTRMKEAVTDKEILLLERNAYNNPSVSMSTADMTRFARRIWNSPAKIRNVGTKAHRMVMRLNNIYSVGDYFFIDFSIENRTNIRFDIDEIRVKLADKKLSKATNAQTIELTPALVLEAGKTFRHGYRNVIVVKKLTFPNGKLLTIEMTEKQISGRNISLNIDYEDVLAADSFNVDLLEEE
jgi:conjugative transposon TraN protein